MARGGDVPAPDYLGTAFVQFADPGSGVCCTGAGLTNGGYLWVSEVVVNDVVPVAVTGMTDRQSNHTC